MLKEYRILKPEPAIKPADSGFVLSYPASHKLKAKIAFCVIVRDILNHLP